MMGYWWLVIRNSNVPHLVPWVVTFAARIANYNTASFVRTKPYSIKYSQHFILQNGYKLSVNIHFVGTRLP